LYAGQVVPPGDYDHYVSKDNVRVIAGTSDYASSLAVKDLMHTAPAYAERYNREVLEALKRKG
jgi:hypothetical protein